MVYYLLVVVAATFLAFAAGECPENSLNLSEKPSICYSFHPTSTRFARAQSHYESFGANLITLKNDHINAFISRLSGVFFDYTKSDYFWSGGYRLRHQTNFKWISGDEFDYENFIEGQKETQRFKGKKSACISVQTDLEGWKAESCFEEYPFICEFEASKNVIPLDAVPVDNIPSELTDNSIVKPKSVQTCKDGWVYYNETKSCYFVSASDAKGWKEAEAICQKEGAHLASIHRDEENMFVMNELNSKYKIDEKCLKNLTWIGFIEENNVFSWTDGTPNDFTDWSYGEPNNAFQQEHCASIYTQTCETRQSKFKWNDFFCIAELPYVCKMPAHL